MRGSFAIDELVEQVRALSVVGFRLIRDKSRAAHIGSSQTSKGDES